MFPLYWIYWCLLVGGGLAILINATRASSVNTTLTSSGLMLQQTWEMDRSGQGRIRHFGRPQLLARDPFPPMLQPCALDQDTKLHVAVPPIRKPMLPTISHFFGTILPFSLCTGLPDSGSPALALPTALSESNASRQFASWILSRWNPLHRAIGQLLSRSI